MADAHPWVHVHELDLAGEPGPRDWACLDSGERGRAARIVAPARRDRFVLRREHAGDERRRLFHRCWVAKEAFAKGVGRGLALPFGGFSVASVLRSPDGAAPVDAGWSVSLESRGGRHLAVALEDRRG